MNPDSAKCAPWGHYDDVDHQGHPEGAVDHLDYITGMESVKAYKRETYGLLGIQPGSMVLDAGCGTGDDVLAMAQLLQGRGRIVGLDSSATMLEAARTSAAGTNLPVEFRLGDGGQEHGAPGHPYHLRSCPRRRGVPQSLRPYAARRSVRHYRDSKDIPLLGLRAG